MDTDWAGDLLGRKSQTFHVMCADVRCVTKRRSGVLRFDPRSVNDFGNLITLPRLDDGCSNTKSTVTVQQQEVLQEV